MRCERLALGDGDPAALAAALRELIPAPASVAPRVAEILDDVRTRGDAAVLEYTRQFDAPQAPDAIAVPAERIDAAGGALDPEVRAGLELAIANVGAVARGWAGDGTERTVELPGETIRLRRAAVDRAAVYVPGGRAPYPSTVVMGVVTARAAGVGEVVVSAPPAADGEVDATVLAACRLAGADAVYRMGGAQAVAALAFGTETVARADVIVGPGNLFVQEAKRQCSDVVGIDSFAGPSDLLLIAGEDAPAEPLALDLLAQAEHGPGTLVVAVSDSEALLDALADRVAAGPDGEAVIRLVAVDALDPAAVALAQAFAPEHLQVAGTGAEALADRLTHAGCLFVGAGAGTAFGDYIAGSNHVLPTTGAARFASGLTPAHFQRTYAEVRIADPGPLARAAAPIARAEGFELHARSMEARIRENEDDEPNR
jgi:histidinol dehydrogenase